jgi:hypothetical protein
VTVPKDRGRDLLQCNDERAGVMLLSWNWSVNLVLPLPTFSTIRGHRRTELDSCCLIQEDTGPIRFGTMMNDYREVVAVLGPGSSPASNSI